MNGTGRWDISELQRKAWRVKPVKKVASVFSHVELGNVGL